MMTKSLINVNNVRFIHIHSIICRICPIPSNFVVETCWNPWSRKWRKQPRMSKNRMTQNDLFLAFHLTPGTCMTHRLKENADLRVSQARMNSTRNRNGSARPTWILTISHWQFPGCKWGTFSGGSTHNRGFLFDPQKQFVGWTSKYDKVTTMTIWCLWLGSRSNPQK